ncbi:MULTISPECIES: N-acetyl-D-Glu racemase DgcA [unclassified Brenneria]|uniref:N-acetyl-D-Glu racemase DgcA n=1 Tax=unclassified Brenneria TaxID=2634434 RepID=UPI0015537C2E|nr:MULTISPECIES: N-acetyl-D-Glu racemase DgcA [unclassified Brenneria]MBJ7223387.1 L-Ala-D/L-Glu epimerase [Brenneria sp. L3-3C-1]MEE3644627.1 N-acetyl-D-Glu racemase DgcA [Brenneria sp. L3_3C_1]MEE3652190.1 N-acetyl-D-Glu racemase DgcA [Brenneria sp. HEZEL_4_2_4]NPD02149.1 L-Ala-D/L-Glu epimerase [Brenneria sp. hezel4-2-4]
MRHMQIETVNLPLARPFTISRGTRSAVAVVRVTLEEQGFIGQGECTPTAHYGESAESVCRQLKQITDDIESGLSIAQLQTRLPPGAARNALNCALWRLKAALEKQTLWQCLGIQPPTSVICAETLSLDSVEKMAAAAADAVSRGVLLLKIKLDRELILEKVAAIRAVAPHATLIIDANEAWGGLDLSSLLSALTRYQIAMVEQPLPAGKDDDLQRFTHPIPICADESCHHSGDIAGLRSRYEMINIKLDKCGGLTEALAMVEAAKLHGLQVMVGCMLGSSMAMEAALPITTAAEHVDLDGPIWLAADSSPYLTYNLGRIWL